MISRCSYGTGFHPFRQLVILIAAYASERPHPVERSFWPLRHARVAPEETLFSQISHGARGGGEREEGVEPFTTFAHAEALVTQTRS